MSDTTEPYENLTLEDGNTIAYRKTEAKNAALPGIIFLGGFKSDMEGSKATFLEHYCKEIGAAFVRFDYFGHGLSSGTFTDGCISHWANDAIAVIDTLTEGPQILIGSSMGGWCMLLAALARKERIAGIMGIASAPDFTEDLIWDALKPEEQEIIMQEGVYNLPSEYCDPDQEENDYPITKLLIEDGRKNLLLKDTIALDCPCVFLHGMQDADVPPELSLTLQEKVLSTDVSVIFQKSGDHRMSSPESIAHVKAALELLLSKV